MDCWATPTDNPDDTTKFELSSEGCPTEDWIELKNASCISFPLFGFASAVEDNLYVHCEIYICTEDSDECETSTCPASGGGRKRRHADAKTTLVSLWDISENWISFEKIVSDENKECWWSPCCRQGCFHFTSTRNWCKIGKSLTIKPRKNLTLNPSIPKLDNLVWMWLDKEETLKRSHQQLCRLLPSSP